MACPSVVACPSPVALVALAAAVLASCQSAAGVGPSRTAPPLGNPASGTCPVPRAGDEVFVTGLQSPIVNLRVVGPWLLAVSGAPNTDYSAPAHWGEILRIERATGRVIPLVSRPVSFQFSAFAGSSYVYWAEEPFGGFGRFFRLALPDGNNIEPVPGSQGCFLVDADAYYTYLEPNAGLPANPNGKPPFAGGLFRVTHRPRTGVLLHPSDVPGRCAWSDSDSIAFDEGSGVHRIHLDGTEETPYRALVVASPSVESGAGGFLLSHLPGGGAALAVVPYAGDVILAVVDGPRGYVAMRPVVDVPGQPARVMKIALLGVTLDGKTPAVQLGHLDAFEDGFAVDDCFVYYASGAAGHSIRRITRGSF